MPEIGDKVFYIAGQNGYPQTNYIVGSSARSWFMSSNPSPWWAADVSAMRRNGLRYDKKEITFVTEDVYILGRWASQHRANIQRAIWNITPEKLKTVAEIIGYAEAERTT